MIEECGHLAVVWFIVLILLLVLGFMTKTSADFSRVALAVWALVVPCSMCLMRFALRRVLHYARTQGRNTRAVAFAGVDSAAEEIHQSFLPGRVAGWDDWLADVAGTGLGLVRCKGRL